MNNSSPDKKYKILLVDDKVENLISLETILVNFNIEFVRALSGNEALTLTLRHEFALALIDVRMPVMDGFETVNYLRQSKQTMYLPVIFISAVFTDEYNKIKGIETGAVDFITKPVNSDILCGKVKVFLDLFHQQKKLQQVLKRQEKMNKLLKQEINSRILAEDKLRQAKKKAEKENKLKSEFLANMSHEIRTPMNAIIGFADLITDINLDNDTRQQYIQHINNSGANLLFLIDDIIDFAKIEAGRLKIVKKDFNLNKLLIGIIETYKQIKQNKGLKDVSLIVNNGLSDANSVIISDRFRLRQVITNLIGNSIKFTTKGKIELGYIIQDDNNIEFYVEDTGKGISAKPLTQIFNRFEKATNQEFINPTGTGLGLHISKNIVELLGGKIWVDSEIDKGTIIHFSIPLIRGAKLVKETAIPSLIPETEYNWQGKTLLVVEDEEINLMLLIEALKSTKIKVLKARNGKEALKICTKENNIDLVLMDIKMPVMDGLEATIKIKMKRPHLPIIAQTALATSGEEEKCIKAGCIDYISKPINRKILLNKVNEYFKKNP